MKLSTLLFVSLGLSGCSTELGQIEHSDDLGDSSANRGAGYCDNLVRRSVDSHSAAAEQSIVNRAAQYPLGVSLKELIPDTDLMSIHEFRRDGAYCESNEYTTGYVSTACYDAPFDDSLEVQVRATLSHTLRKDGYALYDQDLDQIVDASSEVSDEGEVTFFYDTNQDRNLDSVTQEFVRATLKNSLPSSLDLGSCHIDKERTKPARVQQSILFRDLVDGGNVESVKVTENGRIVCPTAIPQQWECASGYESIVPEESDGSGSTPSPGGSDGIDEPSQRP